MLHNAPSPAPKNVSSGVVGLGLMGSSIAACLLAAGHCVAGVEINADQHAAARRRISRHLETMRDAGLLRESLEGVLLRLEISDDYAVLKDCEVVVESVVEECDIKRAVLKKIEAVVAPDALIGSNTSALPITTLQQDAAHPERIVGLHWAEPANLTAFLEVVCGDSTAKQYSERAMEWARVWGKAPVLVRRDTPGFIANRIGYAMIREAFHLVESGVATPDDVDLALRTSIGTSITLAGPFRMMDIVGGPPIMARVIPDLWPDLSNATQTPAMLQEMVESGANGLSSGRGFYSYTPEEVEQWREKWAEFSVEINALSRKYGDDAEPPRKPKTARRAAIIKHLRATPVSVPARFDSLNSPETADDDPAYIAKYAKTGSGNAFADLFTSVKWIVELEDGSGNIGVGETYRAVPQTDVETALRAMNGKDVLKMDWRALPIESVRVYDAIEAAALDLAGKTLGAPVHQLLGGACRERVECSGWTGRRTPQDAARKAREAMERGHRVFKFKCSDTDPVRDWLEAIRQECGDGIRVLLDPNGRWKNAPNALRLMEGVPLDMMVGLEDPIERQDYAGFRELREKLDVPILLHVSLPYRHMGQKPEDLLRALKEECADGFNINGPMFAFARLASLAALDGKSCWHGSEVDLGILEAAALHAAAVAPNCILPCDIFGEVVREDDLLEHGLVFENGFARVPDGPGLGVELDRDALEKYRVGETLEVLDG